MLSYVNAVVCGISIPCSVTFSLLFLSMICGSIFLMVMYKLHICVIVFNASCDENVKSRCIKGYSRSASHQKEYFYNHTHWHITLCTYSRELSPYAIHQNIVVSIMEKGIWKYAAFSFERTHSDWPQNHKINIFSIRSTLDNWIGCECAFCKLIKIKIFRGCCHNTKIVSYFLNCCLLFPNEIRTSLREVFRTQSKTYDGGFLPKSLRALSR